MAVFRPHLRLVLCIGPSCYRFMPDPFLAAEPENVFMLEGSEALIYQVQELGTGRPFALKVAKAETRGRHIEQAIIALARCPESPGLTLARQRLCLTKAAYPRLIATFPQLEYAVLMPWSEGRTWAGFMRDQRASEAYSAHQALNLTRMTALALRNLEAPGLAHSDIAGGNVLLLPRFQGIELLDLEGLYFPDASIHRPNWGSPGYQHPHLGAEGQWCAEGDRFAGATLLTEMLTWWDPRVRAAAPPGAESLFRPQDVQERGTPLRAAVRAALEQICFPALDLFDQAWTSPDLGACPALERWASCLLE